MDKPARAVGYFRVSGQRHGLLRAELESHRKRLSDHVANNGLTLLSEFVDYENGHRAAFVQLDKALSLCRQRDACLVVPSVGLMIRDWQFLARLHVAGVEIAALDAPALTRATAAQLAMVARRSDRRLPPEARAVPLPDLNPIATLDPRVRRH